MANKENWFKVGQVVVADKDFYFYDDMYNKGDLIIITEAMRGHNFEEFCSLLHFAF
jgi:hypothetical protein